MQRMHSSPQRPRFPFAASHASLSSEISNSPGAGFVQGIHDDDHERLRELYHIPLEADTDRAVEMAAHSREHWRTWDETRPIAEHTQVEFAKLSEWRLLRARRTDTKPEETVAASSKDRGYPDPKNNSGTLARVLRPLVLDSGCGTASSSLKLARQFPEADVVAFDRNTDLLMRSAAYRKRFASDDRSPNSHTMFNTELEDLNMAALDTGDTPDNLYVLRAELVDFWRLAHRNGWKTHRHYLLYPNPYPKPKRLKARIYGHPVLPTLVELGGCLEVRSSWLAYCQEFAAALAQLRSNIRLEGPACLTSKSDPITNFERKYFACGMDVYILQANLDE